MLCRHLRTKTLYIPEEEPEAFGEDATSPCWCNITLTETGVDQDLVSPLLCSDPNRTCFEEGGRESTESTTSV